MSEARSFEDRVTENWQPAEADNGGSALIYTDFFVRLLTSKMIEMLRLVPEDSFVDLGSRTGIFSRDILEQVALERPMTFVDPMPEVLAGVPRDERIDCVQMDVPGFSEEPHAYDKVLMKEALYHVDDKEALFRNIYERMAPGGVLLLVHMPPEMECPLFTKALERARQWHADPDAVARLLEEIGFEVERDRLDYRHRVPKQAYFDLVRERYLPVLTTFTAAELHEGVREMERTFAGEDTLEFTDHFDFIAARKARAADGGEPDLNGTFMYRQA